MVPMLKAAKDAHFRAMMMKSARLRKKGCQGPITKSFAAVFRVLLYSFHDPVTGWCFPSHEEIANKAEVHPATVARALPVLEEIGALTWEHRRKKHNVMGAWLTRRTSNAYQFPAKLYNSQNASGDLLSTEVPKRFRIHGKRLVDSSLREGAAEKQMAFDQERTIEERKSMADAVWNQEQQQQARAVAQARRGARAQAGMPLHQRQEESGSPQGSALDLRSPAWIGGESRVMPGEATATSDAKRTWEALPLAAQQRRLDAWKAAQVQETRRRLEAVQELP